MPSKVFENKKNVQTHTALFLNDARVAGLKIGLDLIEAKTIAVWMLYCQQMGNSYKINPGNYMDKVKATIEAVLFKSQSKRFSDDRMIKRFFSKEINSRTDCLSNVLYEYLGPNYELVLGIDRYIWNRYWEDLQRGMDENLLEEQKKEVGELFEKKKKEHWEGQKKVYNKTHGYRKRRIDNALRVLAEDVKTISKRRAWRKYQELYPELYDRWIKEGDISTALILKVM